MMDPLHCACTGIISEGLLAWRPSKKPLQELWKNVSLTVIRFVLL